MSDLPLSAPPKKDGVHVHLCFVEGCGENAYFGFTTRDGSTMWTCNEHRKEGRKHLVSPSGVKRGAAG
jgi:hypothetical protein